MSKVLHRTLAAFMVVTLLLTLQFPGVGLAAGLTLQKLSDTPIGEGTTLSQYNLVIGGKNSRVFVTQVDLNNKYVQIGPVYGTNGKLTDKQTVKGMADERGAIAAVNADFFRMDRRGAPFGIVLDQGKLVSSMGKINSWYSFGVLSDQTAIIAHMGFAGMLQTPDGATAVIQGLNKEEYNPTNDKSHLGKINMYTSDFGTTSLGAIKGYEDAVEMLVVGDTVTDIRTGQPGYTIPVGGYVLWGDGAGKQFLLDHLKVGDSVTTSVQTTVDSSLGDRQLVSAVGGNLRLVQDGQALTNIPSESISGDLPRTAVGVSQDGKTVYIVAVEGPTRSRGVTLDELAQVMQQLGAYNASNFDGGGSTTMVARYPGDKETTLLNTPELNAPMRKVPTGLAVFNTAPPGDFANFLVTTKLEDTVGKPLAINVKAYDTHYLPYDLNAADISWSTDSPADGSFTNNVFTPTRSGQIQIHGEYKGIKKDFTVAVGGVKDLIINPNPITLNTNDQTNFSVSLKTDNGNIPTTADSVQVSVTPNVGTVNGFTISSGSKQAQGTLTVKYGDLTRTVPVYVGTKWVLWNNTDAMSGLGYTTNPGSMSADGSFRQTTGNEPVKSSAKALRLSYDFAGAPNTTARFVYGKLGASGQKLPDQPLGLKLWVYGDNSGHSLQAEVADAKGNVQAVSLADQVNWTGWKEVQADFPTNIAYPVTLRSLDVVDAEDSTLSTKGTLYFDELSLKYPAFAAPAVAPAPASPSPAPVPSAPVKDVPGNNGSGNAQGFSDIKGHWAEATLLSMYKKGIVSGVSSTKMGPELSVTRGQFVTFLDRAFGWTKGKTSVGKSVFKDAIPTYAKASVQAAVNKKIITGYTDGTFQANKPISRAEMAVIMYNCLKHGYGNLNVPATHAQTYKDANKIPSFARDDVAVLTRKGYIYGSDGSFLPGRLSTRAEALVIISRLLK
ncbi:phosphodiester glycosidase family protein [Aneurinibacillus terranovensis]|uniref:phosphodiester glycosidase family protein n=1 Tax=Aneurinibacillus terranovensis TaxID=278991 RepID=UPI00041F6AC2|nr:phosphodiester glycosidase family protein [Aneurinibacillus terranovensis]